MRRKIDGSLGHRPHPVGIHGDATIDGAHDPVNLDRAVILHGDFRNLGAATASPERQAMPRPRPFGKGLPQPAFSAASSNTAPNSRRLGRRVRQQIHSKLKRVATAGVGQLIDEAFLGKRRVGRRHRPPPRARHDGIRGSIIQTEVWDRVGSDVGAVPFQRRHWWRGPSMSPETR